MSNKKDKIKFDAESLERLVNEAYDSVVSESDELQEKIEVVNILTTGNNAAIGLQQYGEVYTRLLETKGKVSDRLIKLTQLIKEVHKHNEAQLAKKEGGNTNHIAPEDLAKYAEQIEELQEEQTRNSLED